MSDGNQHIQSENAPAKSVGTGIAYGLLIAVLSIAAWSIWLVLKACGFQIFGTSVVFYWCQEPPAIVRRLSDLEDRNRFLQAQIHDAQLAVMTPDACGPVVDFSPPPDPAPVLEDLEDASYTCEPDQVRQRPSEIAIVLDGSGSMEYSVDLPDALEQDYLDAWSAANASPSGDLMSIFNTLGSQQRVNDLEQQMRNYPGRSRMEVARDVLQETVQQAPAEIDIDLTYFTSCRNIVSTSFGGDRAGVQRAIAGVRPDMGTPLDRAMRAAARNLEAGATAEDAVNIVLVTDGNDSCGGDPCAAARTLKRQMPGLIINVIDMSRSDTLSCVSDATGGDYRRVRGVDPSALVTAIEEASGYSGPGQCRPTSNSVSE